MLLDNSLQISETFRPNSLNAFGKVLDYEHIVPFVRIHLNSTPSKKEESIGR